MFVWFSLLWGFVVEGDHVQYPIFLFLTGFWVWFGSIASQLYLSIPSIQRGPLDDLLSEAGLVSVDFFSLFLSWKVFRSAIHYLVLLGK